MATQNFFALLSDNELDDPWAVIAPAAASQKPPPAAASSKKPSAPPAAQQPKLPSKPLPPAEAVRESRNFQNGGRGRGGGMRGGRGNYRNYGERDARPEGGNTEGRGSAPRNQGFNIEAGYFNNRDADNFQGVKSGNYRSGRGNAYGGNASRSPIGDNGGLVEVGQGGFRGRGRGRGDGEWPRRREFDRQHEFDHSNEIKGAASGNENSKTEASEEPQRSTEKQDKKATLPVDDKQPKVENLEEVAIDDGAEKKKKAEEDNEMTLDEYEKILDEKRKALTALKNEERKVNVDKAFDSMQLVDKKNEDDVFIKLGFEKEKIKKKEAFEKEEKTRKSVSINEFLKPIDGETFHAGSRARGRGRGNRGGRASFASSFESDTGVPVPRIEDPGQFPTLGGK